MYDEWTEAPRKSGQPWISAVLILAGTLVLAGLIIAVWANRQTLDTDSWVSTSDRVLAEPEVQTELSRYLTDELFTYIDVEGDLRENLPASLRNLEDTSAAGLHRQAPAVVRKSLDTRQFEQIWSETNREAHESLIDALDGKDRDLAVNGGQVILDLNPLLTYMSRRLGFSDQDTAQIPPEAARLTILDSNEISVAHDAEKLIRTLPFVLAFLVVFFFGIAIWVAGSFRRYVVGAIGAGFILAGAIALILRAAAGPSVVDWLTTEDSVTPAADAVWSVGTSLLVTYSIWSMVFGAVIIGGSLLAGLWPSDSRTPDRFQHEFDY